VPFSCMVSVSFGLFAHKYPSNSTSLPQLSMAIDKWRTKRWGPLGARSAQVSATVFNMNADVLVYEVVGIVLWPSRKGQHQIRRGAKHKSENFWSNIFALHPTSRWDTHNILLTPMHWIWMHTPWPTRQEYLSGLYKCHKRLH